MVKAKVFIFQKQFDGLPKETDLKLIEEELPPLKDGEFLSEAVYLSVDPCQRIMAPVLQLGTTFMGSQVAKVIESKNPKYPVGSYVVNECGWRTHTVSDGKAIVDMCPQAWIIPDPEGLPLSLFLGMLGMPGCSAYLCFLDICKPKSGEIVVVSGAAGAVGSHVGQIAKIKGCTVIGIAGSDEKGKWLVDELKFDDFVNYKDKDFVKKLKAATPKGIDCYFDNVGGEITSQVLKQMNHYGRVAVCGSISGYNDNDVTKVSPVIFSVLSKQLTVQGFGIYSMSMDRWFEAIKQNKEWIKEGKLKYRETVTEGFENMYKAFVEMLQGGNLGKAIVKV